MSVEEGFSESPGGLRPSQITTTFGPGSLVQMEHDSVIVMGLDTWSKSDKHYKKLSHPYLEEILGKDHFRMPRSIGKSRVISCKSFPIWGVCSNIKCCRLQRHKEAPPDGKKIFKCDDCSEELYPARFVVMCKNGHLDEFPWIDWAHSKSSEEHQCSSPNPKLRFRARGNSPGLSDYYVKCDDCGAQRTCGGATSYEGLRDIVVGCSGRSPWLGNKTDTCVDENDQPTPVYGVQTRSTSLYYPLSISALYIPEWLHPIQKIITENKDKIRGMLEMSDFAQIAEKSTTFAQAREKYSIAEIIQHLEKRFTLKKRLGKNSTELQIREREFSDLMSSDFDGDEHLEISDVEISDTLKQYVTKLKKIKRITEIRVIRSFTRGDAPDPYSPEEDKDIHYCPISRQNQDWYPAVENKGEGILFTLNEEKLRRWEESPKVRARCGATIEAFETWALQRKWKKHENLTPRYLLLHTLSHALIRELSNLSGYNEASIRERIYRGEKYNGILLYTASPSSDGSLGGLVRQSDARKFERLLELSIAKSKHCSRDPLCAEDDPVEKKENNVPVHARLNGSACYGCALLPETSCENINRLLDRRLLFDEDYGFFREL